MSEIVLSADVSSYNYRAACRTLMRRFLPNEWIWRLGFFALIAAAFFLPPFLNKIYDTNIYGVFALLIPIACIVFVGRVVWRMRRIWRAVCAAPYRSGKWEYRLSEKELNILSPGMHFSLSWVHVVDVVERKDGLLLLTGAMEFFPVPAASAPDDVSLGELRKQIEEWIAKAKAPATG